MPIMKLPGLPRRALRMVKRWIRSRVSSQMPSGPGHALDFGPGGSHIALIAAQRGFNVTAVDLEPVRWF
jgi:2-polyprenyl-3-methyl-5-hydroxy-6-metoxy-1,4-benzoquinol methylase